MSDYRNIDKIFDKILNSEEFISNPVYFEKKFSNSLLQNHAKVFLYLLIKSIRAKSVLEIGTYMAGTTKIISEAIGDSGFVISLESNKQRENLNLEEIRTWDKKFQENTMLVTSTSNDFFNVSKFNEKIWFDFIFVDGDHTYTGALTDLLNSARYAAPGAIIVVDDAIQPPVFSAVKDFLILNKDWREIGDRFNEASTREYIEPTSSNSSIPFLILEGPSKHFIGPRNYSVYKEFKNSLSGLNIKLDRPSGQGKLFSRFLISHLSGGEDGGMSIVDHVNDIEKNQKEINIMLDKEFISCHENPIKVDIHLFFETQAKINNKLSLLKPPEII